MLDEHAAQPNSLSEDVMFGRRMTARPAIMLAAAGALLWSCSSDTHAPSASDVAHPRAALDRHHGGLDGGADAGSNLDENPTISDFVLYAQRSVTLGKGDRVEGGDIGVAALAVQSFGPQLVVGDVSFVDPEQDLLAPSVQLDREAFVGDIETSSLTNNGGKFLLQAALPAPMPPVPIALKSTPGTSNVTVDRQQFRKLAPGAYASLTVNGTLALEPGVFYFSTVTVGDGGRILALPGGADVRISGALATGRGARLAPLEPEDGWDDDWGRDPHCEHAPAPQLNVSVSGYDSGTGSPLAASIGAQATIEALVVAPHGTLTIGDGAVATGAFAAFDVRIGDHARIHSEGALSSSSARSGSQTLSGYTTGPMTQAPVLGPAQADQPIRVGLGLPMVDHAGLQAFLKEISDPTNPQFRHFLDLPTFTSKYGATSQVYGTLATFAGDNGLSVAQVYATQLYMTMTGTVSALEQAFYINMSSYQRPDGSVFYALDNQPSLDLTTPLLRISGLSNYIQSRPSYGAAPSGAGPGTGPNGSLWGLDYRNAYLGGTACLDMLGDGQTIVLYEEAGYNYPDLVQYGNQSGLSAIRSYNGLQYPIFTGDSPDCNSYSIVAGCFPNTTTANSQEVVADIDVAVSFAPHASIYVYENGNYLAGSNGFLWEMASQDVPFGQISDSWRGDFDGTGGQAIEALFARGTSYFYATGDGGAFDNLVQGYLYGVAPSLAGLASVGATLVGGTSLFINSSGAYAETGLAQSTGGILTGGNVRGYDANLFQTYTGPVGTPGYQLDYLDPGNPSISYTYQNVPDVSANATNAGFVLNGTFGGIAGTSVAAPLWAAFTAVANQQLVANGYSQGFGWVDPLLYAIGTFKGSSCPTCPNDLYTRSFNDIADGSQNNRWVDPQGNPNNAESGFSAVIGYDLVTGLGSPKCGLLHQMVVAGSLAPVCQPGLDTCAGSVCCADGSCQTPLSPGASSVFPPIQSDVCCPSVGQVCETECCQQDETCCVALNTTSCCPTGQCLADGCCDGLIDGAGNCCDLGSPVCSGNGLCCNGGQCDGNGDCCSGGQTPCGDTCCNSGSACIGGVCTACPTNEVSCTDESGTSLCCDAGAECCNGACCATGALCCPISGVYQCSNNCTQ